MATVSLDLDVVSYGSIPTSSTVDELDLDVVDEVQESSHRNSLKLYIKY